MKSCTAAVARGANTAFTIEELGVEGPREGEVLVRIAGVGLCHTDLVCRDQFESFAKPAVLGHEGAGVIEALGPGVSGLAVGDKVVLGFSSCGHCKRCAERLPSYCDHFGPLNYAGVRLEDGSTAYSKGNERVSSHFFGQSSFATLAVTRASNVVKVPATTVPLELLGPLGCGLQTGAGAVMRSMDCAAGSTLRRPHERELLELYCAEMSRRGVRLTVDDVWDDYRIGACLGLMQAVFSAAFVMRTERGDQSFLSMATGAAELMHDHDSIGVLRHEARRG